MVVLRYLGMDWRESSGLRTYCFRKVFHDIGTE